MAFDQTKTSYSYTVNADGTVNYTPDCDGVEQVNMAGIDVSSAAAIEAYLNEYTTAYIAGKLQEQAATPDIGVTPGVTQTVQGA